MYRVLRQKHGLTKAEIGGLTTYEIRHHYLTPLDTRAEADLKDVLGKGDSLVADLMGRGLTRAQAEEKAKDVRRAQAAARKSTKPGRPERPGGKKKKPAPPPR